MITEITTILSELSTVLAIPVLRKEQSVKKLVYPYMAWKVLSQGGLDYSVYRMSDNVDPTLVNRTWEKVQNAVMSLSFYDLESNTSNGTRKPILELFEYANKALDWFGVSGRSFVGTHSVVIEVINQSLSDRTAYIDPAYEYQVGFDFNLKKKRLVVETLPVLDVDATVSVS